MAAKFQMWPKEEITSDQIFGESDVVNQFLRQAVWKNNLVSNLSIPPNVELSNFTTHWWKRFQSTSLVSPHPHKPPITTTTSTDTLPANRLPSTGIQPVGHRHQPSGIKRPSPQDSQDDVGNKVKETGKGTIGKDTTVKATGTRESKWRKVSSALDDTKILVSHVNILHHSDTHARQPCNLFFSPVRDMNICYYFYTNAKAAMWSLCHCQ